ncbi:MAG: mechanosensitive ion channel [Lachnospiraceae bacterium]|nr:mechanosensitive ion channel [Lachnospiraceae bacterium]
MNRFLTVALSAVESTEEVIVMETIEKVVENPGIIRTYLEGMVPNLISFVLQVVLAIVVYAIGTKMIKWVVKIVQRTMERHNVDTGVMQFLSAIVKYALYVVVVMTILSLFGVATTSVVAVLGSAGVAIGLALQGSLSNFAGGVLILLLKPFKVGDYIIQGGSEGTVYEISLFYTKLKTVDNKVVVIPNGTLSNNTLVNVSHMDRRRVDIVVGIAYEADIRTAKNIIYNLAQNDASRLPEEEAVVFVDNLGASSVDIGVRLWVSAADYWDVKWRLTENIKYAMDENGISIPYQQIDVQIKQ